MTAIESPDAVKKAKKNQRRGKKRRTRDDDDAGAADAVAVPEQAKCQQEIIGDMNEFALAALPEVHPESNFGRVSEETMTYLRQIEPMLSEEALQDKDSEGLLCRMSFPHHYANQAIYGRAPTVDSEYL